MIVKHYLRKKDQAKREPPRIMITKEAYTKLYSYTTAKTVEIMLFGIVDKKDNIYTIVNFVIPPQTDNSGAFVTTDDDKYSKWLMEMPREERQKLRLHYHTHPKMATTPSSTDVTTINDKVDNIEDYYIRMIGNEKQEYHIDFFDIEKNLLYSEIDMFMFLDKYAMSFGKEGPRIIPPKIKEAEKELDTMITPKTVSYAAKTYNRYGGVSYGYTYPYKAEPVKKPIVEEEEDEDKNEDDYIMYFIELQNTVSEQHNKNRKFPTKKLKAELNGENTKDIRKAFSMSSEEWNNQTLEEYSELLDDYIEILLTLQEHTEETANEFNQTP